MPEITLQGQLNSAGVPSLQGEPSVTVGGRPVHCRGMLWRNGGVLAEGAPHVSAGGRAVGRVGDRLSDGSVVAEGEARVLVGNGGGAGYGRGRIFAALSGEKNHLILCLPKLAEIEAGRANALNAQGWLYLRDMARKWLEKPCYASKDNEDDGGQEPFWVDWDWLMQYERFKQAVKYLTSRLPSPLDEYLFSQKARRRLAEILLADGRLQTGGAFNHSVLPWKLLRPHSFQSDVMYYAPFQVIAPADMNIFNPNDPEYFHIRPDGLAAAIANASIFALAEGVVEVEAGKAARRITVRRVYAYLRDGYDFYGEQELGGWVCSPVYQGFYRSGTRLDNAAFRNFQQLSGYGCDFRVLSAPRLVWEGEVSYVAA